MNIQELFKCYYICDESKISQNDKKINSSKKITLSSSFL